jgi:hypothetical protein
MTFVWEYGLQYTTENLLVNRNCMFHMQLSIFYTLNSCSDKKQGVLCLEPVLVSWINAHCVCVDILKERLIGGVEGAHYGYTRKP